MTDAEKLKLIDNIIADAYEYTMADERKEGYFEGVLIGICAVLNMESKP